MSHPSRRALRALLENDDAAYYRSNAGMRKTRPRLFCSGVRFPPFFEVGQHRSQIRHIDIAAPNVAQVVAMRLFLDVPDAIFGNYRPIAIAEAIDGGGADA